ncbi:MAG: Ppx/GppA phosphatase family protein [Acidobacteriota bacterium]
MNISAIDVGSNAIRMLIASTSQPGFTPLGNYREPVRLGHDVFRRGRVSEETAIRVVAAFSRFADIQRQWHVERSRAVATSAMREAANGDALVDRIRRETGIDLDVISGVEEGRLIFQAVRSRVDLGSSNALIVELGGGSMELIAVREGRLAGIETFKVGAVRLLEMLVGDQPETAHSTRLVQDYVSGLRGHLERATQGFRPDHFIVTGGNAERIATLAAPRGDNGRPPVVPRENLHDLIMRLSSLSFRERIEQLGLDSDRADVILPASIVVYGVMEATGMKDFMAPMVGLKDGVALDLAAGVESEPLKRQIVDAAIFMGRRYMFDEGHARRVARNALFLLDRLAPQLHLDRKPAPLLETASILHDVGFHVNGRQHHKHSYYLIKHSNLPGLSTSERLIVANIARYHRKAAPNASHGNLRGLRRQDRDTIRKLSAIIRIADALDRDHAGTVTPAAVSIEDGTIVIRVKARGEISLEQWAIRRKQDLFEEAFGYRVSLVEA